MAEKSAAVVEDKWLAAEAGNRFSVTLGGVTAEKLVVDIAERLGVPGDAASERVLL